MFRLWFLKLIFTSSHEGVYWKAESSNKSRIRMQVKPNLICLIGKKDGKYKPMETLKIDSSSHEGVYWKAESSNKNRIRMQVKPNLICLIGKNDGKYKPMETLKIDSCYNWNEQIQKCKKLNMKWAVTNF